VQHFNLDSHWNFSETLSFLSTVGQFLPWIGDLDESKTLGLANGSLYEVLATSTPQDGEAMVSAVGFNVTCGYARGVNTKLHDELGTQPEWRGFRNISFGPSLGSFTLMPFGRSHFSSDAYELLTTCSTQRR
jgi:hypothetical protein